MFKVIFSLAMLLNVTGPRAEEGQGETQVSAEKFNEFKEKRVKHLEEKIAAMTEVKNCVSSANDKEAMKACNEKMKEMHKKNKEHREEMMKNRKNKKK